MAALESVTAPLVVRQADGSEQVVAACFPHPLGVLYLDLFWHWHSPQEGAHLLKGELRGDGPWRVGDAVIRTLGCRGTDPHLQGQFIPWRDYLAGHGDEYPPREQILDIARRLGAAITT